GTLRVARSVAGPAGRGAPPPRRGGRAGDGRAGNGPAPRTRGASAAPRLDPDLEPGSDGRHVRPARGLEERARTTPGRRGRVRAERSAQRASSRERRLVRAEEARLPLPPGGHGARVLELRRRDGHGGLLRRPALWRALVIDPRRRQVRLGPPRV